MKNNTRMKRNWILALSMSAMLLLSGCGLPFGTHKERAENIPTEDDVLEAAERHMGISGAQVLSEEDVRDKGIEYYGIDAIYEMTSDRGLEFIILRSYTYDTTFGTGYNYKWTTNYTDVVIEDYIKDNPLPDGCYYSDESYGYTSSRYFNSGASKYFGDYQNHIHFQFHSDAEFEEKIEELDKWLVEWVSYEQQFLVKGAQLPRLGVVANRPQDETMKTSIQVCVLFGYEKDSKDAEMYKWSSFKKGMKNAYNERKKFDMK